MPTPQNRQYLFDENVIINVSFANNSIVAEFVSLEHKYKVPENPCFMVYLPNQTTPRRRVYLVYHSELRL